MKILFWTIYKSNNKYKIKVSTIEQNFESDYNEIIL